MTADRAYRAALGHDAAQAELRAGAGTQFDPARRGSLPGGTRPQWATGALAGRRPGGVIPRKAGTVCQHTNKGMGAMRGFGLTIEPLAGDAVRVALRGELDLEHAYTFDEELKRVEGERPSCVVLDLRGLSFLDSCGLARLLAARRRARREKRRLLLVRGGAGGAAAAGHHGRRGALRDGRRRCRRSYGWRRPASRARRSSSRTGPGTSGSKNVALRLPLASSTSTS